MCRRLKFISQKSEQDDNVRKPNAISYKRSKSESWNLCILAKISLEPVYVHCGEGG
jgi:hypothetical protein